MKKQTEQEQRIANAETVRHMVTKALKKEGLLLNGFQYPLVGELSYRFEVECSSSEDLSAAYITVSRYADEIKGRIKVADVHIGQAEWKEARFVLIPYGSKA